MTLLTFEQLADLDRALGRAGWPGLGRSKPPVSAEQLLTTAKSELGLDIPQEVLVWWTTPRPGLRTPWGNAFSPPPLRSAIEQTLQMRELQHTHEDSGLVFWREGLLLIANGVETVFACDCSQPGSRASAVWVWNPKDAEQLAGPSLPSLGALVEIWIAALDEGIMTFDPKVGGVLDYSRLEGGRWPANLP